MSYESGPTVNAISFPVMFPTFQAKNPHSLFRQVESIFLVRGISKQNIMFNHVLSALPTKVVSQFTHAIDKPPEDELYTTLKCAVIRLLSGSHEKRLQQLFSQTNLGDHILSMLLRHMETLVCDSKVDDTIFQQLLMRCLPSYVAACLASCSDNWNL